MEETSVLNDISNNLQIKHKFPNLLDESRMIDPLLRSLSFADLEALKSRLDTMRQQILVLQNSTSLLFKLPGELRNRIFLLAMHFELQERRRRNFASPAGMHGHRGSRSLFAEPSFFRTSRQIRMECAGIWSNDVIVWEEWVPEKAMWRILLPGDLHELRRGCENKAAGRGGGKLVLEPSFVALERTRGAVKDSTSVCPRRGLARVVGSDVVLPQIRWWIW